MDSVEIAVRFAGTLLQVARVSHGGCYRIGTARDVDLPLDIAPLTSFPLVDSTPDGFVVRCPAGVPAVEYTAELAITVSESVLKLARGSRIDVAFGNVMVSIARTSAPREPLARPRWDVRPHVFALASLAAHVMMLVVAVAFADIDELTIPASIVDPERRPTHVARFP